MWLRMDFVKAEVKKRIKPGKRYKMIVRPHTGEDGTVTKTVRVHVEKMYQDHVLCMINDKYHECFKYIDLMEMLERGELK